MCTRVEGSRGTIAQAVVIVNRQRVDEARPCEIRNAREGRTQVRAVECSAQSRGTAEHYAALNDIHEPTSGKPALRRWPRSTQLTSGCKPLMAGVGAGPTRKTPSTGRKPKLSIAALSCCARATRPASDENLSVASMRLASSQRLS